VSRSAETRSMKTREFQCLFDSSWRVAVFRRGLASFDFPTLRDPDRQVHRRIWPIVYFPEDLSEYKMLQSRERFACLPVMRASRGDSGVKHSHIWNVSVCQCVIEISQMRLKMHRKGDLPMELCHEGGRIIFTGVPRAMRGPLRLYDYVIQ